LWENFIPAAALMVKTSSSKSNIIQNFDLKISSAAGFTAQQSGALTSDQSLQVGYASFSSNSAQLTLNS